MRAKTLFVLLGVTALGAYTVGRYSRPADSPPASVIAHSHPAPVKAGAPKGSKVKTTDVNYR